MLVCLVLAASALQVPAHWEIINFERALDASKSYLKMRHDVTATNIGTEPVDEFVIAIPKEVDENRVIMIPILRSPKTDRAFLEAQKIEVEDGLDDVVYYVMSLPVPISPKSTISLSISIIATHQLKPVPESAPMRDIQALSLKTLKYPISPYVIRKYALALMNVANGELKSDSKEIEPIVLDFHNEGKNIISDPGQGTIKPNTYIPLNVYFTSTEPLPYVTLLQRDYWVSHWGNTLQLEEYYELTNNAVKLDSGFNRADWINQRLGYKITPAMTSIQILLPEQQISDAYFTDKVGNVSTSQFVADRMVLKPRFPIFGGWHYNFTVGWNHKLSDFLKKGPKDEYILKVKLMDGLHDASYEKLNFSVYLPEGAEYISTFIPFKHEGLSIEHSYSYLDIENGHTKITLTFNNLVDELKDADVYVRYKYSFASLIRKPLITSLYVFITLLTLYVLMKVNLSIRPARKID
ncbi:hypothetical protein FOA43_003839 [Brettanomyces nanus]|uniref:Dolichyl-diphosphooligosaccharide--protein glycosyltransferase subunit 1 n=1 Tax=Eeniella nana TaxID=13502 RepID=A0A875RQB8_EENNA|nr:uncharacterized protein FOA43_003839 [Brettanomyces nanus]QPG76450.1 hypothetical protein FOA43_003839 [Brettanomyces nanus]